MINTAFNITAKQIRQEWPIIEVSDDKFNDYILTESYKNFKYVWVVKKKYKSILLTTFDWSYSPSEKTESVHLFPLCFDDTKKPVIWDAVKLVPINALPNSVVKSNIIVGYVNTPFYYTIYDRGLINKVISKPAELRYRVAKTKSTFTEMLKEFTFKKYNKDYALFVDVDVNLDISYNFELPPNIAIYHYSVTHSSTNMTYADNSVVLVPYLYIEALQDNKSIDVNHVVIDDVVGELNDLSDPEFAWARAYSTTGLIMKSNFLYKQRNVTNKILTSYLSTNCKLSNYVINGCSQASKDIENNIDINFEDFKMISKRFVECVNKNTIDENNLKPLLAKLEIVKRVYGEDSEQYKTLFLKLKSI